MAAEVLWAAILLACMPAVWAVFALIWMLAWRAIPAPQGQSREFAMPDGMRWIGPVLMVGGPGLAVFALLVAPIGDNEWLVALFVVLFVGGLTPVTGAWLLLSRFRTDDAGLVGYGALGFPAFIAWHDVHSVVLGTTGSSLQFRGHQCSRRIPLPLKDWPVFVREVEQRLSHLPLPAELSPGQHMRSDSVHLAEEMHWQAMYDHAGRILLIALLSVAATLPFLGLQTAALPWSALAGVALVFYPVLRRLWCSPGKRSAAYGNAIQSLAFIPSFIGMTRAQNEIATALGGDEALSGGPFLLTMVQAIGLAVLVGATLILLVRWRWPDRYARRRMAEEA